MVDLGVRGPADSQDTVIGRLDIESAPDTAIAASGLHEHFGWTGVDPVHISNRAGWTMVHTGTAGHAGTVGKAPGRTEYQARGDAAAFDAIDELSLDFLARVQAPAAIDAQRSIKAKIGVARVDGHMFIGVAEDRRIHAKPVHESFDFRAVVAGVKGICRMGR